MQDFTDATYMLQAEFHVYALYQDDILQYIGYTSSLRSRLAQHKQKRLFRFNKVMVRLCKDKIEMVGLESRLIHRYRPPYNQQGCDVPMNMQIDLQALGIA